MIKTQITVVTGKEILFMISKLAHRSSVAVNKYRKEKNDPYWNLAGKLISWSDIPNTDHTILRENIATELSQMVNNKKAKTLENNKKSDILNCLCDISGDQSVNNWKIARLTSKMERDLHKPYNDKETLKHIADLNLELKTKMEALKKALIYNHKPFPIKIFLFGSFVKGRLGANSDLDILFPVKNKDMYGVFHIIDIFDHNIPEEQRHEHNGISFMPYITKSKLSPPKGRWGKPMLEVPIGLTGEIWRNSNYLIDTYKNILGKKGITVKELPDGEIKVIKTQKYITRGKEK